jgi:ribulose-5-phosphate 4-epimerase/fuculose-1-phosphate aldolase
VLDRHGPLALGKNLAQAFGRACTVEDAAQVAFLAEQLGKVRTFAEAANPSH